MDGTLVKFKLDFDDLKRTTRKILEEKGIYIEFKGSLIETMKELKSLFLDEGDYNNFVENIKNIMIQHEIEASEKAEAFSRSKELLDILKSKGKNIGVVTRNNKIASIKTLETSGLIEYIDVLITRDDVEKVKPDPHHVEVAIKFLNKKAEETVVIGDHKYDIISGKKAGCFTIGVLSEISSEEFVNEADLLISSVEEILSFL